jgi:hypothetical protein
MTGAPEDLLDSGSAPAGHNITRPQPLDIQMHSHVQCSL